MFQPLGSEGQSVSSSWGSKAVGAWSEATGARGEAAGAQAAVISEDTLQHASNRHVTACK